MKHLNEALGVLRDLLEGKGFKVGTKRKWKNGYVVKQADGSWEPFVSTISAKFPGKCPGCGKALNLGDPIASHGGKWKCADCVKAQAEKPAPGEIEAEIEKAKADKPKKPKAEVYNPPAPEDKIETKTCGRCGGSGKYSYNMMTGDRCFECGGVGTTLSKRGGVANDYLKKLRQTPVAELKVGDIIKVDANMFQKGHFTTVKSIEPHVEKWTSNGVEKTKDGVLIHAAHPKYGEYSTFVPNGGTIRKGLSKEQKAEQNKKAFEFQKGLNYNGTPKPGAVIPPEMADYFEKKGKK